MVKKGKEPSERGPKDRDGGASAEAQRETGAPPANRPKKKRRVRGGQQGVVGSADDSRRCTAKANRTGERCRAPAIKGGVVCRVHGGAAKHVQQAAKERLLGMVEPAMVELRKIIAKRDTTDADKLRAIQMVLDRTGYGPRSTLAVDTSRFDAFMEGATTSAPELNRSGVGMDADTLPGGGGGDRLGWEDVAQHQTDARNDNWRDLDAEDAPRRIYPDATTVVGEVVPDADA